MAKNIPDWLLKLLASSAEPDDTVDGVNPAMLPPVTTTGAPAGPAAIVSPMRAASAGLHINLVWDSSVTNAAFKAAVQSAASMLEAAFSNPITLNIAVGWGEYLGNKIASTTSALGGGWSNTYSYATVKSALLAHSTSADDASAYASLPANFTANSSGTVAVYSGEAKALGLVAGNATALDGFLGFGTSVPAGNWVGVALHEITHAFGRISGYAPATIEDLFRYSAANTHNYAGPSPAYFSVDGGQTRIANFSTSSDYGDWANDGLTTNDPFNAFYTPSTSGSLTGADLRVLDVLGFTRADGPSFTVTATSAVKLEAVSGTTPFSFTITRGGSVTGAASVAWSVTGSGANAASAADFAGAVLPSGSVSFAAGEVSKVISVSVAADGLVETDEGFTLTLSNPSTGTTIRTASASGTIQNSTASLSIAAANAVQRQGTSGSTPFTFTVTRSGYTGAIASAHWAVSGSGANLATAADFVGNAWPGGTVTFAAGQTTQTVTVNVLGATALEPDEGFTVTLSAPNTGNVIGQASANGLILTNGVTSSLAIAATNATRLEGITGPTPFTFTVTRSGVTAGVVTARYTVAGSGANAASAADFGASTMPGGTVTFAAGQTSQTITVNVAADGVIEADEGFSVTLSEPSSGSSIATGTASGTILNGNAALSISAANAVRAEGAPGSTTPFTFTVARSGYTGNTTTVTWSVAGSGVKPAVAADFVGNALPSGSVSFAAGETSKTLTVNVAGDSLAEPDEGFTVSLGTPSGGVALATAKASGTILASSAPVGMRINLQYDASVANAPSGFREAMQTAANLLQAAFSDAITVNIAVGWGEVGGTAITASGVAEGGPTSGVYVPYASLKSGLLASARSATDSTAYASLSDGLNPNGNGSIAVWSAQEKALGIISGNATAIDGVIGFSTNFTSSLWVGAALHEITHAMGRTSGYTPYGIADLFRYSAPGARSFAGTTPGYASIDGGRTVLANYSTSSDYGDFATNSLTASDPFNAYIPAGANSLTAVDLSMMDILGFTRTASATASAPGFIAGATGGSVNGVGAGGGSLPPVSVLAEADGSWFGGVLQPVTGMPRGVGAAAAFGGAAQADAWLDPRLIFGQLPAGGEMLR
jgi:hypothetical protein